VSEDVLGVLHFPWGEDYGIDRQARRTPTSLWRRLVVHKANPRSADYMASRFAERYPEGKLVRIDAARHVVPHLGAQDAVVILYPDAIGLGFGRLERGVGRAITGTTTMRVLNGRRREFELTPTARRRLRVRRAMERTMFLEVAVTPLVVLAGVGAMAFDLVRDRR
jgi:hypothetical protein